MSNRDQEIIAHLYRMVQSLRGGDNLPIVCGEHGPKMDGMPRYLKVSPSPGITTYAAHTVITVITVITVNPSSRSKVRKITVAASLQNRPRCL